MRIAPSAKYLEEGESRCELHGIRDGRRRNGKNCCRKWDHGRDEESRSLKMVAKDDWKWPETLNEE